jgi:hypothetical protein
LTQLLSDSRARCKGWLEYLLCYTPDWPL